MEKDHRLFLRNLPPDISNEKLEKLFEGHGRVTNVDVKEKLQSDGSRIAFVNLTITDKRLNTCFQAVNGKILNGNAIRVEVAKESYLDRLKREREEAANKKDASKEPKVLPDRHIERINIKVPVNIKTKATKRIYNFDELANNEAAEDHPTDESGEAPDFAYDPALVAEEKKPLEKQMIIESREIEEELKIQIPKAPEKKVIGESEMKRLASVKRKRQAFGAKEQLISHALKAVDSSRNKKIVFSYDIDVIGGDKGAGGNKSLFNDEDEDNQTDWNEDKFEHDEKRSAKLAMSMNNLGRDKRFAIDERFLDDYENASKNATSPENNDNDEMDNETQWQLGILQDVLGKPIKARDEKLEAKKENKMVRYDPTASGHRAHELEMTKRAPSKAQKRKLAANATREPEEEAAPPIPVSSQVFYSVSDNLADTLKVQEEFSLLKTFGTAAAADKNRSDEYDESANAAQQNWQCNFDTKNPFKYESSDDEGPDPTMDQHTRIQSAKTKMTSHSFERNDCFFFVTDDQRFRDAEDFFVTRPSDAENFNNVRRELKMIVRKKVRNNVKKSTPWRNKKIGRIPKSR